MYLDTFGEGLKYKGAHHIYYSTFFFFNLKVYMFVLEVFYISIVRFSFLMVSQYCIVYNIYTK